MIKLEIILEENHPQSEQSLARMEPAHRENVKREFAGFKLLCFACFGKLSGRAKWCPWCGIKVRDLLH